MKQILLVEDDIPFRNMIQNVLELLGFEVRVAENGLVAKTIFDLNSGAFDLIISDFQMPELDGLSLLKHTRALNPSIHFILMTGHTEALEAKQADSAIELGASQFLSKPFGIEHLKTAIRECFDPTPAPVHKEPEETVRFCKIPVAEFITSSKLLVDLYIGLTSKKYIKIAYAGSEIPVERLKTYMERKVEFFYVRPEDMRKLVGLNLKLNKITGAQKNISEQVKLKLLANTAKLITQSYYYDGLDKNSVAEAAQVIDNTLNVISEDQNIMTLLKFLQTDGDKLYAHSVAVSVYSCVIAKTLGHTSTSSQSRLAMAGLLHDIGKKELPPHLLTKNRLDMNHDEVKLYESHPQRGKEILSQISGLPDDVVQIVAHHHETIVGTGFPYNLAGNRIHPLAKIVGVANFFISNLTRLGSNDMNHAAEVIKKMTGSHAMDFDKNVVDAFISIFIGTDVKRA